MKGVLVFAVVVLIFLTGCSGPADRIERYIPNKYTGCSGPAVLSDSQDEGVITRIEYLESQVKQLRLKVEKLENKSNPLYNPNSLESRVFKLESKISDLEDQRY